MKPTRRKALAHLVKLVLGTAWFTRHMVAQAAEVDSASPREKAETPPEENYSARKYGGAKGDGTMDDTIALQRWINYLVANHRRGTLGAGTYRITAPLDIPAGHGWAIDGEIQGATRIVQATDDVPIINVGGGGGSTSMHSWRIANIEFDYAKPQPATNIHATPLLFSTMVYEFELTSLRFSAGSYAIKVESGTGGPWGGVWDQLIFGSGLSAGAMDWAGCVNAVPNNKWGRLFVDCQNMSGPVFNNVKGYNWVIDTIEFIAANHGAQLLSLQAGSVCSIGAMKLENGIYRTRQSVFLISTNAHVSIGQFNIGGNRMILNSTSGPITVFDTSAGGPTGTFELGTIVADASEMGGNVFLVRGNKGEMRIKNLSLDNHPWQVCDNGSSTTGETLTIDQYRNERISQNLGDANYVVRLGDPNILSFESPLTAPRVVDLPASLNNLFNGLYYEIRAYGAVHGSNNLVIRCGGVIKYVINADKTVVRFTWRRDPAVAAGWIVTRIESLA